MKTLKSKFVIIIFLGSALLTKAQEFKELEGYVTDNSGNPIVGVTVNPKGTDLSATTDEKGYYKLQSVPDSVLTLIFNYPDMEAASASIGLYNRIDVQMSETGSVDLLEISLEDLLNMDVTTVSKSAEKLYDAPGVISVITQNELLRFGGVTLKDVLERVPGLIGSTVYMTDRSTIAPRGDQIQPSSSHVLLLLNGRPVREALEGGIKSEMYEAFPVNIIEKIEVIRGPGSVLYGSNAFSAVINVITKEPDENHFSITGLGGIPGDYGASGEAMFSAGDFGFTIAGKYMKRQDWETDWEYPDPAAPTGATTIGVTMPNEGLGTYLGMNYKNIHLMASYDQWENYYFITDYAFIFPAHGDALWKKGFADLGYDLKVHDNWDMDFNVTYTRSTFKVSSWPDVSRDSYEVLGEWTNFIRPLKNMNIIFGGLYDYIQGEELMKTEAGEIPINDNHRYSFGIYTQVDYKLFNSLKLIGGLQANKVEELDLDVVPRGGIIWNPIKRISVKALYSQAFRAPSINEFGLQHPALLGNPDLKPEKVNTIDIGVNYQGENFQAGINYFYSKMVDVIIQDRSDTIPFYNNIGEIEFQGVELEGKYYISREFFFTGSILYQKNKDKEGNENASPISNMGVKAGFSYMSENGITASIFNIYQGSLDDSYDTELNPSPGAYNLLNAYLNFDLMNLFNVGIKQEISFFIQANNLLNQEIWLPAWGLMPGSSIPTNRGIALYLGLKVSFL